MSAYDDPPFDRGQTFGGTATTDGAHLLGAEYYFEDLNYGASGAVKPRRTNRRVKVRIVRNSCPTGAGTATAILPKRLCNFKSGTAETEVDGYATVTAARCRPADEFLPAAGAVLNDLFYVVMEGPGMCRTDLAAPDAIAIGDCLVSLTAATSGATTAGRVDQFTYAGATTALANQIQNCFGRALSAKSSSNTDTDILVDVGTLL